MEYWGNTSSESIRLGSVGLGDITGPSGSKLAAVQGSSEVTRSHDE